MATADTKTLNAINKVLDKFATRLSPELSPVFTKIRGAVIDTALTYYIHDITKSPESLRATIYIIIVMKSYDIAQITKTKSTKDNLDKIRQIALKLVRKSIKTESIKNNCN